MTLQTQEVLTRCGTLSCMLNVLYPCKFARLPTTCMAVYDIEFHDSSLERNLALVSMGAATYDASASMAMMSSTWICLSFIPSTLCGLQLLCCEMKLSRSSAVTLNHLGPFRLTNSNKLTRFPMSCYFSRSKSQNTIPNKATSAF